MLTIGRRRCSAQGAIVTLTLLLAAMRWAKAVHELKSSLDERSARND
jgi:hypothetical protein